MTPLEMALNLRFLHLRALTVGGDGAGVLQIKSSSSSSLEIRITSDDVAEDVLIRLIFEVLTV